MGGGACKMGIGQNLHPEYIKNSINYLKDKPAEKWAKDSIGYFSKWDISMINKYMKMCLTS